MSPRRAVTIALALGLLATVGAPPSPAAARIAPAAAHPAGAPLGASDPTRAVDLFQGTQSGAPDFGTGGGAGNTFPGATVPFGMVQFSPDTFPSTDNFASGYSYEDRRIRGFSLDHVSGGGCAELQDIPILPIAGGVTGSPVVPGSYDLPPTLRPSFSHAHESAAPGAYAVTLRPGSPRAVSVQLTATTRTGDASLRFPAGAGGSVLIDGGGSAMGDLQVSQRIDPGTHEVTGFSQSGFKCFQHSLYRVYFAARFSAPFAAYGTWRGAAFSPGATGVSQKVAYTGSPPQYKPIPGGPAQIPGDPSRGAQAGSFVTFAPRRTPVQVRIGISFVSVADARANLDAETGGRSFDQLRAAAHAAWRRRLSKIAVSGGTAAQRRLFYTALYHAQLMPNVFSDVNRAYRGMDGRVHHTRATEYANFSGWDIYRSEFPLLAILDPAAAAQMVTSLVDEGDQSSGELPKWPLLDTQNQVMVGDPADPLIAGAWAFGARRFDLGHALADMARGATRPGVSHNNAYVERAGLADYERLGYVPFQDDTTSAGQTFDHELAWGSASTTLEYALDDFSIARLARAARAPALCRRFATRSGDWRALLNPATELIGPRLADGQWVTPSDPTTGFAEGDAAQYTWSVPQDVAGLVRMIGGPRTARARLDSFFTHLNAGDRAPYAFLGNEPSLQTPYLYDWLGDPGATGAIVHRALTTLYAPRPTGYPGNDDAGEMASWWVLSALGIYPAVPGTGVLALSAPLFPRAVLHLAGGELAIDAPGAAVGRNAITTLSIDGRPWPRTWLSFDQLARGASLRIAVAAGRSRWGTAGADAPPSFSPAGACRAGTP